jgi:hypothetical protein
MNRRITVLGVGAVLAVAGLAGCTKAGASSSGMGTPAGGPIATASQTGASQPTTGGGSGNGTGGGSGNGSGPAECKVGQLDISITAGNAGAGHRSKVIVFRNTGSTRCVLQGYPGVAALNSAGNQVAQAKRTTSGYLGGVASGKAPLVNLAPGQSASATVEALAFGPNGESCTGYAGLLVTPPDETHSVRVDWGSDGCSDLQIHPVVPGTSGSIA